MFTSTSSRTLPQRSISMIISSSTTDFITRKSVLPEENYTKLLLFRLFFFCVDHVSSTYSSQTRKSLSLLHFSTTSDRTMPNPKVNVILLTSKLKWGDERLTLFLSRAGTSRPTLLEELCIREAGTLLCTCVCKGGVGGWWTGEQKHRLFQKLNQKKKKKKLKTICWHDMINIKNENKNINTQRQRYIPTHKQTAMNRKDICL